MGFGENEKQTVTLEFGRYNPASETGLLPLILRRPKDGEVPNCWLSAAAGTEECWMRVLFFVMVCVTVSGCMARFEDEQRRQNSRISDVSARAAECDQRAHLDDAMWRGRGYP